MRQVGSASGSLGWTEPNDEVLLEMTTSSPIVALPRVKSAQFSSAVSL